MSAFPKFNENILMASKVSKVCNQSLFHFSDDTFEALLQAETLPSQVLALMRH